MRMTPIAFLACTMAVGLASTARGEALGAPGLEPALRNRDDIVFFEDFEQADFHTHWNQSYVPSNCGRVSDPAFQGDQALRVTVPQGQHTGIAWQWKFNDFGLSEPDEIYFRYYMRYGDSWRLGDGLQVGKLPGPAGTYNTAGWGGRPSHGDDGWSARMSNFDRGDQMQLGYYCYHADMTGTYGDNWTWDNDGWLNRDQWYSIETYVKMNTITDGEGNNDGILRGWVNGKPAFERTNIDFRDTYDLAVQMIWFNVYVGGTWTAPQDMDVYFDNMVIARDYIGPMAVPGDANGDFDVDSVDLATLGVSWDPAGTNLQWDDGDFDGDGDVDAVDLANLGLYWNPAGYVPEPASLAMLGLCGLVLGARRHRRDATQR